MHCNTLDIRRRGGKQDYFPDRGPAGIGICKTELSDEDFQTLITKGPAAVHIADPTTLQEPYHKIPKEYPGVYVKNPGRPPNLIQGDWYGGGKNHTGKP
jgi:hypothetical protein